MEIQQKLSLNPRLPPCPHEVIKVNITKWILGVLYGNGAFYSLTARRKGSYVTIPVQIPKSPFYSVRLDSLVWAHLGQASRPAQPRLSAASASSASWPDWGFRVGVGPCIFFTYGLFTKSLLSTRCEPVTRIHFASFSGPTSLHPHGGVQSFHQTSTCITQLTKGPSVVQI